MYSVHLGVQCSVQDSTQYSVQYSESLVLVTIYMRQEGGWSSVNKSFLPTTLKAWYSVLYSTVQCRVQCTVQCTLRFALYCLVHYMCVGCPGTHALSSIQPVKTTLALLHSVSTQALLNCCLKPDYSEERRKSLSLQTTVLHSL